MRSRASFLHALLVLCLLGQLSIAVSEAQQLPQWRAPVPLAEVNTDYHDKSPFLSHDGLTLYFARQDGPGWHYSRLFRATRESRSEPFGAAEEISTLNDPAGHVTSPWVSPDNLRLYYYTTGLSQQLRLSQRGTVEQDWLPGGSIVELNQLGRLAEPTLTTDERTIIFSGMNLPGGRGDWDLWMASRPDRESPFGNVVNLAAINSEARDGHASVSADGLTLYFMSKRQGRPKIYRAHRTSLEDAFASVTYMTVFDVPDANCAFPHITSDGKVFYFGVYPEDAYMDLYVSHALGMYYVDGSGGSDSADGLTPQSPLATIQRAIDLAEDGDVINVCPGVYRESVRFAGKALTVQSVGDAAVLEAPGDFAVSFYMGEGPDCVLKNVVVANSYVGVLVAGGSPTISNVTVVGNEFGVEAYRDADPRISNCIVWGNSLSDLYGCRATYSCIQQGAEGEGNFSADPIFVDPESGDYHLRSARGRYWPAHDVWVLDDTTSPCVDAGDPAADFSGERKPNGGRLNVGAYGGSAFASMSELPFPADVNGDGLVDETDLAMFTDLWIEQSQEQAGEPTPRPRR